MKTTLVLGISLALALSACSAVKKTDTDEILKKAKADTEAAQKKIEEMQKNPTAYLTNGGQPGKITLSGVILNETGALDTRITTEALTGKNFESEKTADLLVENEIQLNTETKTDLLNGIENEKTYINLGCKDVDATLVDGLTEIKSETADNMLLIVHANTVLVCGELKAERIGATLSADHLILNNTKMNFSSFAGQITLAANTLTILGANQIRTFAADAHGVVLSAPSINVSIIKSLDGTGTIALRSQGGNNVKAPEKYITGSATQTPRK